MNGLTATHIDPATESSLTNTPAREIATWSAGTLPVDQQTAIDISDRDGRVLGDVDVTSDPYPDRGFLNSADLASGGILTISFLSDGAEKLQRRVVSDNIYDVEVDWLNDAGAVIFTDTIASDVAGGTTPSLDELAIAPVADVRIVEQASAASVADGVVQVV